MDIPIPPDHGPFAGVPMGDPIDIDDNIRILDPEDDRDDYERSRKKDKKNKDDKSRTEPSRPVYEGYTLERIKPISGGQLTWKRCGRRALPLSQDELKNIVTTHRKLTGAKSADKDFQRLNADKQGIINRILDEKRLYEKSKSAEWTLAYVQNVERRVSWTKTETVRMKIVIKRTDEGNDKSGYSASGGRSYPAEDVIDLSMPLEKKKDKNKDKHKNKHNRNDSFDPLDDPMNLGFGPEDLPPQDTRNDGHYHEGHQQHWEQQGPNHPPPQAPWPPGWQQPQQPPPNPYDTQASYPIDPHGNFAGGPRDYVDPNPFQPQPGVGLPGQYDEQVNPRDYIHPHGPRARTRSADRHRERSRSRRRRHSSARRRDDMEDISRKVERMYRDDRDSNSSAFDERSMWSRSEGARYDRSPDTSVYSDEVWAPQRARSKPYHSRARHRSDRYQDAVEIIEPGYTVGRPRDRRDDHSRRRPALPRAETYAYHDDYPPGRSAEPRYLPAPPLRRNTDFFGEKRGDFLDREYYREARQPIDAGYRGDGRRYYL